MGKRGQRPAERTLVCVIQALMGLELLVELRNDLSIRGILDDCDNAMKYTYSTLGFQYEFCIRRVDFHLCKCCTKSVCAQWRGVAEN